MAKAKRSWAKATLGKGNALRCIGDVEYGTAAAGQCTARAQYGLVMQGHGEVMRG